MTVLTGSLILFSATMAMAADVKTVLTNQFQDYVKDLEFITNIDSGTGNANGSAKIAAFLKGKMEALGATVELRKNAQGTHVIARLKGEGVLRLLFLMHTDTVFEAGEAVKRPFRIDENQIAYGPGAGDDKASTIQAIYFVQALKALDYKKYGEILLYFDAEEEVGSATEDAIVVELAQKADVAFVLDTGRPGWGIVTQRKGSARYDIQVQGITGHAGNGPHASASATMELANQIVQLYKLASPLPADPENYSTDALKAKGVQDHGQFIPENSINVGVISTTNTKRNRVPQDAAAQIEVRCYTMAELERLDKEIKSLPKKTMVAGAKVTVTGQIAVNPMEKTPRSQKIIDMYKAIVTREYQTEVVEWIAGGMTVGNTTAKYIPTVDALGVDTDPLAEHTEREYVDLKTFVPRTVALVYLIQDLCNAWPLK